MDRSAIKFNILYKVQARVTGDVYKLNNPLHVITTQLSTAIQQLVFQSYWLLVFLTRQTLTEGREKAKKKKLIGENTNIPTGEKLMDSLL